MRKDTRSPKNRTSKFTKNTSFRSGFEEKTARFLDEHGTKYGYETDKVQFTQPEAKRNYTPDFSIQDWFLECKGRWLSQDRQKIKMVLAQNPDLKLKMLFMRDDVIRKGSKTRYSDVCKKLGIDYAISPSGSVPARWLTG